MTGALQWLASGTARRAQLRPTPCRAPIPPRAISCLWPRPRPRPDAKSPATRCLTPRYSARPLHLSWSRRTPDSKSHAWKRISVTTATALLVAWLYPADASQFTNPKSSLVSSLVPSETNSLQPSPPHNGAQPKTGADSKADSTDDTMWAKLASTFDSVTSAVPTDKLVDILLPEWTKQIPGFVRKLQRELDMAPGSLAAEIWEEASDPSVHPEIQYPAKVRVSEQLCDEEQTFLERRRKLVAPALARYLSLKEEEVHPDDVPVIAMCGSGGGLRALVAGTGSFMATAEDGLFDCVTYASGVSGSCWLQSLFYSSITQGSFQRAIDHLKARLGTHIAYPPVAFSSLTSAPTNKYLLSSLVEKLKGDPGADFGLVDIYGILLAARLLVPKGELGVDEKDFKLSNQQEYIRYGQNPMPIYTAVRHEIPELNAADGPDTASEETKEIAKKEAWFQWFEITPYEFFCEEFSAGIPTWALGRKFKGGADMPSSSGLPLPEVRMPLLLGIWGSAFCATLSHYYREIRPIVRGIGGFQAVDELIWGHNDNLTKVHPIEPATVPNFLYGMSRDQLPRSVPDKLYDNEYLQLMDAGMSNNLPIYPLLRPGRNVDIVVAFDASADIKTDNWLSVVEGYARQRGIKGWPVGIGWPKQEVSPSEMANKMDKAQSEAEASVVHTEANLNAAKAASSGSQQENPDDKKPLTQRQKHAKASQELGYCTVWVGSTEERRSNDPPPPPLDDLTAWKLMEPDAGIAVVYLPLLANPAVVPNVDPAAGDYMSTWNFVYTPDQVDDTVELARANYAESRDQIRDTVRAVYERKKKRRLESEKMAKAERFRRKVRLGTVGKLGEGDHFS